MRDKTEYNDILNYYVHVLYQYKPNMLKCRKLGYKREHCQRLQCLTAGSAAKHEIAVAERYWIVSLVGPAYVHQLFN